MRIGKKLKSKLERRRSGFMLLQVSKDDGARKRLASGGYKSPGSMKSR